MVEVVAFKAEHLDYIFENGLKDPKLKPMLRPGRSSELEKVGGVFTALEDGKAIAVGGILEYWKDRGEAWVIFGDIKTSNFITVFKMLQRGIDMCTLKRIEMIIDYDFTQGHRWAALLGFKKEADRLRHYRPEGGDVSLYAKVRA